MPRGSSGSPRQLSTTLTDRARFAWRNGMTFQRPDGSYRRSVNATLGYKDFLQPQDFILRYQRGGIAKRLVEAYPKAAWVTGVELVEDEDVEKDTAFEQAARELFSRLGAWERLQRADVLAGLGNYGVILIGGDGSPETELKRFRKPDDVLFLTPLSQVKARVASVVKEKTDKRFGLPEMYTLNLGVGTNTNVSGMPNQVAQIGGQYHWSRIIHVAHGLLEDDVYGTPVLQAVWNYLDDIDKVLGGGAEATWKNMDPPLQVNVVADAQLGADQVNDLEDQVEELYDGLRRSLLTQNTELSKLAGVVPQIEGNAITLLKFVAGTQALPMRILIGSEMGKLASVQDRDNWFDRVTEYRREFAEPTARMLVDRFIEYGALPAPKANNGQYKFAWPEEEELAEKDKAAVVGTFAAANQAQAAAGQPPVITSDEIRDRVLGMEPLDPSKLPPPPQQPTATPPPKPGEPAPTPPAPQLKAAAARVSPVRRVVAEHAPRVVGAVLAAWMATARGVDAEALDRALAAKSESAAARVVADALDLSPAVDAIAEAYQAGGEAAAAKLAPRFLYSPDQPRDEHGRWGEAGTESMFKGPSYAAQSENSQIEHDHYVAGYRHAQTGYGFQKRDAGRGKKRAAYWRGYTHGGDDSGYVGHHPEFGFYAALAQPVTKPADAFSLAFNFANPRAVAWATEHRAKFITEVGDSVKEAVAEIIKEGLAQNLTRSEVIKRIRETVGLRSDQVAALERFRETGASEFEVARYGKKLLRDRAELIARTETSRAANEGQLELWKQAIDKGLLPEDQQRQWIGTDDGFERPSHVAMNDETTGVNEPFIQDDGTPIEPGEEPNCRCEQALYFGKDDDA